MKTKYRIEGPNTEGFLDGFDFVPVAGDLLLLNGAPYTVIAREIHYTNGTLDAAAGGLFVIIREGTGQLRQ